MAELQHISGTDGQDSTEEGRDKEGSEISEQVKSYISFPTKPSTLWALHFQKASSQWTAVYWSHSCETHEISADGMEDTQKAEQSLNQPLSPKSTWPVAGMKMKMLLIKISSSLWEAVACKKDQVDHKSSMFGYLHHLLTEVTSKMTSGPFQSGSCESTVIFT